MSGIQRRWSYPFIVGLALFLVCLAYIPHWETYAPHIHQSVPIGPYLTPWTVLSVTALGLALAVAAAPFRSPRPSQSVVSKTLALVVFCFAAIFLLEYICGIRSRDLDIFYLPDFTDRHVAQYSARPTPHSATTSLLFSLSLLFLNRESKWRVKAFQLGVLAALALPTLGAIGYLFEFIFPPPQPAAPRVGLSIPAIILYFTLGSGFLSLGVRMKMPKPEVTRADKIFGRWV